MLDAGEGREKQFGDRTNVSLWDGDSDCSLASALGKHDIDCVETCLLEELKTFAECSDHRLSLTMTTRAAFRNQVAKVFAAELRNRTQLSECLYERIYTLLQETIMNAVVHGNLRLDSDLRDSFDGLSKMQQMIEDRLLNPLIARSIVRIEANWTEAVLELLVQDCGAGYQRSESAAAGAGEQPCCRASGKGLAIVEALSDSLTVFDGGRAIMMSFRR